MIKFQAIRKYNGKPVATRVDGIKKLATFICYSEPFRKLGARLEPVGDIIVCRIKGVPLEIPTNGTMKIRERQLFTRFFDFYEVK